MAVYIPADDLNSRGDKLKSHWFAFDVCIAGHIAYFTVMHLKIL